VDDLLDPAPAMVEPRRPSAPRGRDPGTATASASSSAVAWVDLLVLTQLDYLDLFATDQTEGSQRRRTNDTQGRV
jgi:hypothetical protein